MIRRLAILTLGLLLSGAVGTGLAASNTSTTSGPAVATRSERFDFNTVLTDSPATPPEWVEARKELAAQLEQTHEGLDRAQAHLAMANWFIGVPTARPATRWLLGVQNKTDPAAIAAATRDAARHLEQAQAILDKASKSVSAEAKQRRRELLQSAETIGAFVDLFKNVELASGDAAQEIWRKAARGLAVARESQDAEVASAAQLWQAFALEQAGKRDRALEVLPDALAKPEHLPYDLMSRLLRIRLVAESGQYAASVSLLSRAETSLKNWMGNQHQERNNARRLIGLVQHRILQAWILKLRGTTHPEAADNLAPLVEKIERSFAEVRSPNLYCMASAVPLQVKMPTEPSGKASPESAETRPAAATSTSTSD